MKLSVIQLIKLGKEYLSIWPNKPELLQYFEEYRSVKIARFICNYFPGLAIFIVVMQLYVASGFAIGQGSISNALNALPVALVYGLFLLSMPIQALVFSGVKADKLLPPSLASWYLSGLERIKHQEHHNNSQNRRYQPNAMKPSISKLAIYKPRYIDLAKLLQLTFSPS